MQYEFFIAKRFLKANRKRGIISFINLFAILGIMLGTAALVISLAVVGGFKKEVREKVIGFTSHIQITGFENQPLAHYKETSEKILKQIPNVTSISPYAAKEGLIRSKENIEGVYLKGVEEGAANTLLKKYIVEVNNVSAKPAYHTPELVLGKKLAHRLNVKPGDKVIVFNVPNMKDGIQPRAKQFTVEGIYETGMSEYDEVVAFTDLPSAQRLFQIDSAITGFDVFVNDIAQVETTATRIRKIAGYPYYPQTVFALSHNLFSWLDLQTVLIPIIIGLIAIVAFVNIIGTLLMLIIERTKDIGILKSLGSSDREVSNIFLMQGMFIGTAGMILGNLLGLTYCLLEQKFHFLSLNADVYFMSSVPVLLKWENFVIVSLYVLLLSFLTSLIASRAIVRIKIVESLRFA